jgi:hypothetical protein
MTAILGWVPVLASFVLGILYLSDGEGASITKVVGVVVFLVAAYLQFFSPYMTAGVLLQVALAFTLEVWRRML